MTETYNILKQAQNDLKYLNRWNMDEFCKALFANTYQLYIDTAKGRIDDTNQFYIELQAKWDLFNRHKMEFIWYCSYDKLEIMAKAIDDMKSEELAGLAGE
jgi:hypothetical protein